ncbi:MAG: o-succinylbenzoate synthase [Lentimicrobium sp.]|jgi:O-succinylbenzoate synthase|nr:o-succinylbenzoate synthase [Lentimicrobium sp.]
MKIDRIELRHTKMILVTPFVTSMGTEYDEQHIMVRVDAEGVTGWGECVAEETPFYSYETVPTAWHILNDFLIPAIIGKDISSVEEAIARYAKVRGHMMAKAGLEAALYDAFAKSKGISLSKMLGGTHEKINVGISLGINDSVSGLLHVVEKYMKEGYQRIKIKIAPQRDLQFVEALRREYPDVLLQVDANSAYTLDHLPIFKEMDQYNLSLIEQPLGYDDIFDHSKLQREIKTDLCLDESIHSLGDTRAAIEMKSCRIINIKPGRVGGYTESIKIHDYCASANIPVWHGGMLESGIGRAGNVALASLPNFTLPSDLSANKKYYTEDIVEPLFSLNSDGTITVPSGPGIGVEVNMKALEKYTLRKCEHKG